MPRTAEKTTAESIPPKNKTVDSRVEPNLLDFYDTYTYHFRLYMVSEDVVASKDFGPASRQKKIVIAESGATSISIDDVQIKTVGGISREAGIGLSTNFSMTLIQPFGATLLDLIFQAAQELGIKNYHKVPFFLELSFRAREPERLGDQKPVSDDILSNLVWVWPLLFTKMAININAGGSVYALNASLFSDVGYTNQASDLEKTVTVNASTVGEFFDGLQAELNKREKEKVATQQVVNDIYEFYIDSTIYKEKIVPENTNQAAGRSGTFTENNGKLDITFQPGTSIDRIVDSILSTTAYFRKKAKGTEDPNAQSEEGKSEDAAFPTLYRLLADANIVAYDSGRNDYAKRFRYMILPYEMPTLRTPSNTKANLTSQQRYDAIKKKGVLKKIYNYIYTGLNDQVLEFDLTFNFNWYAALPFQAGVYTNFSSSEPGGSINTNDDPDSIITTRTGDVVTAQIKSSPLGPKEILSAFGFADDVLSGEFDVRSFVSQLVSNGINNGQEDQLTGSVFNAADLLNLSRQQRIQTSSNRVDRAQQNLNEGPPVIEDQAIGEKQTNPFPISYIESSFGGNENISSEDASSPGKTMLSALFEQAKAPTVMDLLNIDLKIKGDPYWLEPSPVGRNTTFKSRIDLELESRGIDAGSVGSGTQIPTGTEGNEFITANNAEAQTFFLFRSFTPQEFDEETGITPRFTSNNVINGVYGVRETTSQFAAGKFTQSLSAVRYVDITINNIDFLGDEVLSVDDIVADQPSARGDEVTVTEQQGGAQTFPYGTNPGPANTVTTTVDGEEI